MKNDLSSHIGWLKSKMIYEWFPFKAQRKLKFYKTIIKKNDLCIDVGAHLGDRSKTFLDLGAKVIAVEPQPQFVNYLKDKFQNQRHITIVSAALSHSVSAAKLFISSRNPTLSTLSGEAWQQEMNDATSATIEFDQQVNVVTSTLDHLSEKHGQANFIKIDVEGFELQVLQGLSYQPDYISIEFLSFDLSQLQYCIERLHELGYELFNWSYKETFKWNNAQWTDSDNVINQIKGYDSKVFSGDVYAKKESI